MRVFPSLCTCFVLGAERRLQQSPSHKHCRTPSNCLLPRVAAFDNINYQCTIARSVCSPVVVTSFLNSQISRPFCHEHRSLAAVNLESRHLVHLAFPKRNFLGIVFRQSSLLSRQLFLGGEALLNNRLLPCLDFKLLVVLVRIVMANLGVFDESVPGSRKQKHQGLQIKVRTSTELWEKVFDEFSRPLHDLDEQSFLKHFLHFFDFILGDTVSFQEHDNSTQTSLNGMVGGVFSLLCHINAMTAVASADGFQSLLRSLRRSTD